MRIALISPYTLPVIRGNSITAERIKSGLSCHGISVNVFNSEKDRLEQVMNFKPDIIHCLHAQHSWEFISNLYRQFTVPLVTTLTGTDYSEFTDDQNQNSTFHRMCRLSSAVITFHDRAKEQVVKYFPDIRDKIHIIPQTIDVHETVPQKTGVRRQYGFTADDILILTAAAVRKIKNLAYAVHICGKAHHLHSNVRLILCGPVIEPAVADSLFSLAETTDYFYYLGELSQTDLKLLMHACDIYLNTSLHEGMCGALMEAMAAALPVMASEITGNASLIKNGENGFLAPLHSEDVFTRRLCRLIENPELRKELGEKGRRTVMKNYFIEKEIKLLINLYRKLDAGHKCRSREQV